jgi:CrcB protein
MNEWILLPAIALGGAAGATLRLVISARPELPKPWGVLACNLLGSLALGLGWRFFGDLPLSFSIGFGTGFCGALTTFSSFIMDLVSLAQERRWKLLSGYAVATLVGTPLLILLALQVG